MRRRDPVTTADVAELFQLALTAGLTVGAALPLVAGALSGAVGAELRALAARVDQGEPLADALARLPSVLGDSAQPLASTLSLHVRYGLPALHALERLAHDARLRDRLELETRARRLPVTLLFPLVCCILPAFVLLTLVPLIASTLSSLSP